MAPVDIFFHPEAAEEYAQAWRWYAERRSQLAAAFERELQRSLELIAEFPDRWPRYEGSYRQLRVRRFSYLLIYRVAGERVWVHAVAHHRRRPGYWRGRMGAE